MQNPADDNLEETTEPWSGDKLRSTITFLMVPGIFFALILVAQVKPPGWLLYGFAGILGLVLFVRSLSDPEWLLAIAIIYMPLSKMIVVPIAPGINGTNLLIGMLLISWYVNASGSDKPLFTSMPNSRLVGLWALISCFSGVTAAITLGVSFMIDDQIMEFKAWIDQFIIFFAFLNLIRTGNMAKRLVVYMSLGFLLVMILGVQEMLEKSGLDSIEKSRVLGPQLQPNDFGAFLVYNISPFLAYFLHHIYQIRAWFLAPVFLVTVKLLLTTFSRGAYIGLALVGLAAGYVRGKVFLAMSGLMVVVVLASFPELIPEALVDRMSQTTVEGGNTQQLDDSSQTRIVLWKAAVDMTLDYPIFGTGFKAFTEMKDQYTEYWVQERDNHNMYLFISSQMGIPALLVFLFLLYRMYALGARLYRQSVDRPARIIGLGGAAMVAGVAGVNMFGSRMVGIDVNGYFWVYLAVLAHLWVEHCNRTAHSENNENEEN